MDRILKIEKFSREVFIIDYSDCKEDEMISLVTKLREQILENNKSISLLSIYNDKCFVTPKFMRHAEEETRRTFNLIEKQAVVGLNDTKKMILKGYNFLFKKNIQVFASKEVALEFLFDSNTTDKSTLWENIH